MYVEGSNGSYLLSWNCDNNKQPDQHTFDQTAPFYDGDMKMTFSNGRQAAGGL